jgi:hypothetical protein
MDVQSDNIVDIAILQQPVIDYRAEGKRLEAIKLRLRLRLVENLGRTDQA